MNNVVVYSSLCLIILIILLCITVRQKNKYKKKKRYNRGIILLSILCVLCVVFLISGGLSYTSKDKEDKTDKLHKPDISSLVPNVFKKDKCELIVGDGATPIDCDCSKLSKTNCLNVFSNCPSEKELASNLTLNKCKQCRWSLTKQLCEPIPDNYKIRATLG